MGQDISTGDGDDFTQRYEGDPTKLIRDMDLSQAESIRKRILSDHTSLSKLPKTISMNYKAIFVEYDSAIHFEILFMENEEDLTVGWLMSETLRKVTEYARKNNLVRDLSNLIALKTKDKRYAIDYWLSNNDRNISLLKDRMVLVPYFSDEKYLVKDQKITIDYFEILKMIGEGGFSKVYMARRKDTGQFYAIKVISKLEMIKRGKEDTIFKERNIMTKMEHPYIVKLHFAFQTEEKLFLVLDFLPGGELFYHIRKRRLFSEEQAKVYAGEIILGLNYLHKNNLIYRDLKPENILVDMDGHLNLADFGLCKEVAAKTALNYTFCGSPEYMAPEVISKVGYNYLIDYYALGVLVYELVVGAPPFIRTTNADLYAKILYRDVYMPGHLSSKCKDFLSALLTKDPKSRLGAKSGMSEIINHPWIKDLNYGQIILKKLKVPIKPDPYNLNFDQEFIDVRTTGYDIAGGSSKQQNPFPDSTGKVQGRERIANFSFYSNFEEPLDKFVDSLFHSLNNSPGGSPQLKQRSSIILQSPEGQTRLRKLFESKGLIANSDKSSVVTTNREGAFPKSPTNVRQTELRGPKIDMKSATLRSEIFTAGSEEEKADLDIAATHSIDQANKDKLEDNKNPQKYFISNIENTQSTEENTPGTGGLPGFSNQNTKGSNNGLYLTEYSRSSEFPGQNNPVQSLGISLTPPSRFQTKTNMVSRGSFGKIEEDSLMDSPSVFDEKRVRMRPKKVETEKPGLVVNDIDESYSNEISLFSKNLVYQRDPRVNLSYINSPTYQGTTYQNPFLSPNLKPNNYKVSKFETEKYSNTQVREPGKLLQWNEELKNTNSNNWKDSGSESPTKIGPSLKINASLGKKEDMSINRKQAPSFNLHDSRLNTEIAESRTASPMLFKKYSDNTHTRNNYETRTMNLNSRPSMPSMPTLGSKFSSYQVPPC